MLQQVCLRRITQQRKTHSCTTLVRAWLPSLPLPAREGLSSGMWLVMGTVCSLLSNYSFRSSVQKDALRQQLAAYLEDHPYTQHVGTSHPCHLREFLSEAIESNDSFNADTEQPTEEDALIRSVPDRNTQLQLRWCKYIRRLRSAAWGDHIAVQGLANMLHVDIHILAMGNPNMEPITSAHTPIGVLHLGLIGQFHYMAFDQADTGHCSQTQDPAISLVQTVQEEQLQPPRQNWKIKSKPKMMLPSTTNLS